MIIQSPLPDNVFRAWMPWIYNFILKQTTVYNMKPVNNKNQSNNTNVDIKKGKIKNIGKYLSIFNECKDDNYISHGEVLYGRATHDLKWVDDIMTQMKHSFIFYLFKKKYNVFEIYLSGELEGFAIIEQLKKTKAAILLDIMVKKNNQRKGIGKEALQKIEEYLKKKGMGIMMLESGIKNESAHHFFEKNGYTKISVEFSKKI